MVSGARVPAVKRNCIASSSVQSVEITFVSDIICMKPEVGLGEVGTYTTANSSPLALSIIVRVTNPMVFISAERL